MYPQQSNFQPPRYQQQQSPPNYGQQGQSYGPPQSQSYMQYGGSKDSQMYGSRPFGMSRNDNQHDDMMREFNTQTNENIQSNLSRGAAISELEMILDGERRRAKDLKQQMEMDLEGEKRTRLDFENKLLRLKEDAQRREMFVTELEYKLQTVTQENESVVQENRLIKDEVNRMQEMYGHKIRELEDKYGYIKKQGLQQEDRFRVDFDRMKSDYEQKMEGMNREWEYRLKAVEEKCKNLTQVKADMEQEIRYLQDNTMKIRLEAEEDLREAVVRVQDEEMKKYMSNMRSLEQRYKASEEARENFGRKNLELGKEISERDKHINQMQMDFDQQANRFKQELSEYHNQLNQSNIARDKLRNELQGRDAAYQRIEADLMGMQKQLSKDREGRKLEIDHILEENNKEKRSLEDIRDQQARKINDQDKVMKQMEQEIERLRAEYERLCQSLQNNVHRSINQTLSENSAPRFDNRRPQFGNKYE